MANMTWPRERFVSTATEHHCRHCPALAAVHARHPWAVQRWARFPRALTERLLPSANPFEHQLRWALYQQLDLAPGHLQPRPGHRHDLFTDGSCAHPSSPSCAYASWAVISASHNLELCASPLGGLQQDVNRAELRAILAAVTWLHLHRVLGTVWPDSAYAACGCAALVQDLDFETPETNSDLWRISATRSPSCPRTVCWSSTSLLIVNTPTRSMTSRIGRPTGIRGPMTLLDELIGCGQTVFGTFGANFAPTDSFAAVDRFRDLHLDCLHALCWCTSGVLG